MTDLGKNCADHLELLLISPSIKLVATLFGFCWAFSFSIALDQEASSKLLVYLVLSVQSFITVCVSNIAGYHTKDELSNLPNLGPSASQAQSCKDVSNSSNIGALDCRTNNTVGGYENIADGWGSYKIIGGTIQYDGAKSRVERFF